MLAIARVTPKDQGIRPGSAFAIAPDLALTASHCVRGRDGALVELRFPRTDVVVRARAMHCDQAGDVALLRLEDPLPTGCEPVGVAAPTTSMKGTRFDVLGFGADRPPGSDVHAIDGHVIRTDARPFDGPPALQLSSEQVAAGEDPHQFSGAPVLVAGESRDGSVAVGIVRWARVREEDPSRAIGGVFYATSLAHAAELWSEVQRTVVVTHHGIPWLRQLVAATLDENEIRDLVQDEFPEVRDLFTQQMDRQRLIRELVGWCSRHRAAEKLSAHVERVNPDGFRAFHRNRH